jgi:Leucine-rich repeat (LRR) protein
MTPRAPVTRGLAALLLVSACVSERSPTAVGGPDSAGVYLLPALIPSPADDSALPVNRVRAVAMAAQASGVLADTTLDVDPAQSTWTVDLRVPLSTSPTRAIVLLYLMHETPVGEQTLEFSGQTDTLTLVLGQTVEPADITLVRGPLSNLLVTGISVASTPLTVLEGQSLALTATAQISSPTASPLVFWTSLDTMVVRLDSATALGVAPGAAQVIASAGAFADTASITVLPRGESGLCSDDPPSAIAAFEDANLEAAVRSALGLGAQDSLVCDLVTGISELDASGLGIASLEGAQSLTGLTTLVLDENSITDLSPLSGLTGLTDLRLFQNAVEDISALSGLTALDTLEITGNQITDVRPLGGLTTLTTLWLGDNSINDMSPLASLTNLTDLRLYTNELTDITPVSDLPNLTFFTVNLNSIEDISPVRDLPNLQGLAFGGNPVTDMSPISGLLGLTELYAWSTLVSDAGPVTALKALTVLELQDTGIGDIGPLAGLVNLSFVRLDNMTLNGLGPLLQNPGLEDGDTVNLTNTVGDFDCGDVDALRAKGVTVIAPQC